MLQQVLKARMCVYIHHVRVYVCVYIYLCISGLFMKDGGLFYICQSVTGQGFMIFSHLWHYVLFYSQTHLLAEGFVFFRVFNVP